MAKKKELKVLNALKIFWEGLILYFKNVDKFVVYMTFPILGQVLGISLIFTLLYFYTHNITKIITICPFFNNTTVIFLLLLLITAPGFAIFFAAFWKYLVAIPATSLMTSDAEKRLTDLKNYNEQILRHSKTFLGLLILFSLIMIFLIIPFVSIILLAVLVYFSLAFQIFALDSNLNPIEILKRSFHFVKGNFLQAFAVLMLLGIFTYYFLPQLFVYLIEKANIMQFLVIPINNILKDFPVIETEKLIQTMIPTFTFGNLSAKIINSIIISIIIGYTLPLRSLTCTLLYKDFEHKVKKENKIKEL